MATAGQPITYTAEVIGGAGSLCPALVGNPTLRRLGASILTDWFENGDGMLVLNTKDAMDAEVNHVKFFRILLRDFLDTTSCLVTTFRTRRFQELRSTRPSLSSRRSPRSLRKFGLTCNHGSDTASIPRRRQRMTGVITIVNMNETKAQ